MSNIIMKKPLARLIETAIHKQRLAALPNDNVLIDKEMKRFESLPVGLRLRPNRGTLGEKNSNHGCEARGI